MEAKELLLNRSSMPRLVEPAPSDEDLALLEAAALRVPDHMSLTPYQVISFQGEYRAELGDIYQAAAEYEGFSDQAIAKAASLPLRAPLVLMVATNYQDNDKVPTEEQYASAACAAHAILQMAFALGYGAIWRTGPYAQSQFVKDQLELEDNDILGFIYIGTPAMDIPIKPAKDVTVFREYTGN